MFPGNRVLSSSPKGETYMHGQVYDFQILTSLPVCIKSLLTLILAEQKDWL
jgi:hypothetical protein